MRSILRSKIHKAHVTLGNINYIGSITIPKELIEKAGFWLGEKVLVVSNTTGARLETYIIEGENSGEICMNGASAHLIKKGEEIIIMGFEITDKKIKPKNILVDKKNRFVRYL
jgi:aspartate 1-decarboxylase